MPAEHALLGLLALAEGNRPGYGYDLARDFEPGRPLGEVLRLEPGMLYHHLKKLERAGWVEVSIEDQIGRPPRRLYALTATGHAKLDQWLSAPVSHTREIRLEFLVKLYLLRTLAPDRLPRLLAEQRLILERNAESIADSRSDVSLLPSGDTGEDEQFLGMVRDLRSAQTRAAIDWLDDVQARINDWVSQPDT